MVTGVVIEPNGSPLAGATVVLKNSTRQTIADAKGVFSIAAGEKDILVVTYVGYTSREINVGTATTFSITLTESVINLDEVVMNGYAAQKVKEITGSVAVVKPKDLTSIPAGQVEQMLQGRVAGLTVISSGEPGAATTIRLHGIGNFGDVTPLYIIDGIQGDINSINPYDIESLQVLKDAGAYSIYGVRGANGVIVVTTKKGKPGKVKISYDMYLGLQLPVKGPDNLNPQENADLLWLSKRHSGDTLSNGNPNDYLFGNGKTPVLPDYLFAGNNQDTLYEGSPYVADSLYNLNSDQPPIYQIVKFNKAGTDWFHEMYKPAFSQNHIVSFSGGNEKNQYLVSLGYLDQQGTMVNTYLKRFTARINTAFNFRNNFHFGENLQLSFTQNSKAYHFGPGSPDDTNAAISGSPAQPIYDTHGGWNPGGNASNLGPGDNPVARREMAKDNKANRWQVLGDVFAALDFAKYFTVKSNFGGSLTNSYNYGFMPASYDNVTLKNALTESAGYLSSLTWTNGLYFTRAIGENSIKVMVASEIIDNNYREIGGSTQDLSFTDPNYWLLSNGNSASRNYSIAGSSKISSFIGRFDYGFSSKYFLTGTIRRDGSSVFGPENRFGWFPSLGLAWRLSEEKFMQKAKWVTELKVRGSWGKTGYYGNTDPANQFTLYGGTFGNAYYDIFGVSSGSIQRGFYRVRTGNAKTGWQEDEVANFGLEGIFWKGKFSFSADLYRKESKGLLFPISLPDVLGDPIPPNVNVGNIRNSGIDITLGSKGSFSKNWRWDVLVTYSHFENKIISLNDLPYFNDWFDIVRNQVGHPIGSFFGYRIIGLFQDEADVSNSPSQESAAPGRFKYDDTNSRDVDGRLTGKPDGKIDDADRTFYGNPHPDFTLGINIGISFCDFDLSTFFYGSFGNTGFNAIKIFREVAPQGGLGPSGKAALYNSWTPDRKNTTVPIAEVFSNFSNFNGNWHSYALEKGSYLRNKSLILGYTLPRQKLVKMKVDKLRFYIQAVNLFTMTNYSGLDPEVINGGIDFGYYPNNQKQFLFGLTLGL